MNLPDPVTGSWERNSLSLPLGWLEESAHLFIVRAAGSNGRENMSTLANWSALERNVGARCSP